MALVAAVMIAPVAGKALTIYGFTFPFARIFDRAVMATMLITLLLFARRLALMDFLLRGFRNPRIGFGQAVRGLVLAAGAIGVLFVLTAFAGGEISGAVIASSMMRYLPAAVLIGAIEESFFRAFLLAGMEQEFGSFGALIVSSAIYALVHVARSPARVYLTQFEPTAGVKTLVAYAERMFHPEVGPLLFGLFLLGLVLGAALILTRRVYCSLGLHVGFVLGAKTWRLAVSGTIPRWIAGPGAVPLVAAPAGWVISAIMLIFLPLFLRNQQHLEADPPYGAREL